MEKLFCMNRLKYQNINLLENEEDEQKLARRYSSQLDTPERRGNFAQRLKEALRRERESTTSYSTTSVETSSESSYAVGISVSGSHVADQNIKFVFHSFVFFYIQIISLNDDFYSQSQKRWWINGVRTERRNVC